MPIVHAPLRAARLLSRVALASTGITLVTFAALHLLPPTSAISPVHRTISEYALTSSAWAFDLGVIALCTASIATFAALVMLGRLPAVSVGTFFGGLWVAGLLTLVTFPKHNFALGGSGHSGQIHRMASLVAFLALPVAVLVIARRGRRTLQPVAERWAFWLGVVSLVWFSPIVVAVLSAPRAWWQLIPLGLFERGLALTEVCAVIALAVSVRALPGSSGRRGIGQTDGQVADLGRTHPTATADH